MGNAFHGRTRRTALYVGDLRTHLTTTRGRGSRSRPFLGGPLHGNILPQLYEAMLDGFSTLALRLQDFERHAGADGGHFNVQPECHVELP